MEQHTLDLLHLTLWVIGGLGGLIAVLLTAIAGLARWGGVKLFDRLGEQDTKMDEFKDVVASKSDEIRDLLTSETQLLRESQHKISERVGRLEVFRDYVQASPAFGRRWSDQETNGND